MSRKSATFLAIAALFVFSRTSNAQVLLTLSGGASVASGDFGDYAKTGFVGFAGVLFPIAKPGLVVGAHLMYGSNSHSDIEGDKTNLLGALGTVGYRFGDPMKPGVFVIGNVGMLQHKFVSDLLPSESESGLAVGGGVGFELPLNRFAVHATAGYLTAKIGDSNTSIIPLTVGVTVPLGMTK